MDIGMFSLLIAACEDVPQIVIISTVVSATAEWSFIIILTWPIAKDSSLEHCLRNAAFGRALQVFPIAEERAINKCLMSKE